MKRSFLKTGDGSITIHLPDWDEQYHSKHGAIAEAKHVFIQEGLDFYIKQHPKAKELKILEIGFGTGLNCLLTQLHPESQNRSISYMGVEKFPVLKSEAKQLNFASLLDVPTQDFMQLHELTWEQTHIISSNFNLFKQQIDLESLDFIDAFDLIYFDAFGPRVQPELWSEAVFATMFKAMAKNGVLVTYSAKGDVRRAMRDVGFTVERLPGPPGKRHMLRAVKLG